MSEINVDFDKVLEISHFHFSSGQLYEDFREAAEEAIKEGLNCLETLLISKCTFEDESIKGEVAELREFFLTQVEAPLLKFKNVCGEIFRLPPNIAPWGYSNDEITTPEELELLEKEVQELEEKYLQEVSFGERLQREKEKFEEIRPLYNETREALGILKSGQFDKVTKLLSGLEEIVQRYTTDKDKEPVELGFLK